MRCLLGCCIVSRWEVERLRAEERCKCVDWRLGPLYEWIKMEMRFHNQDPNEEEVDGYRAQGF